MSADGAAPMRVASRATPSTVTVIDVASATTWALVMMWPASSITTPVPAPWPSRT